VFDLILLDPPYDIDRVPVVLAAAARRVTASGLIVLEHATRREPEVPAGLTRVRGIKSGDSSMTLLSRDSEGE
jgi:16S rRNA G966 N2-methylase RsmD